jgi:hypothetical protein
VTKVKEDLEAAEEERDAALRQAETAATNELKAIEESLEIDARAEELGQRVAELESTNQALQENLKAIATYREPGPEEEAEDPPVLPETVETWQDLTELLLELDGPGFRLTDRALECAEGKGRYPHPDAMWRALRSLERVGRAYNELGADLGRRFDEFALEHGGIEVALQDTSYELDCFFEFEGEEYSRLPHVKVDDAKSPNAVGRIYFALDPEHKRLIVDWFGTKPDRPRTAQALSAR